MGAVSTAIVAGVIKGAVVGAAVGGAVSKVQGGSFSKGALKGATTGAVTGGLGAAGGALGGSLSGGAVGSTAFNAGKAIGGIVGGAAGAKLTGASTQTAFLAGAASGFEQFGSALNMAKPGYVPATKWTEPITNFKGTLTDAYDNFKAAAKAAPVTGQLLGSAILSGAAAPRVQTGFQMQAGKEKNDTSASESKTTPGFEDIASGGKPITDANFGGTGIAKSFDPSLGASYQAPPAASVASVGAARKSFLISRNMKRRGMPLDYGYGTV